MPIEQLFTGATGAAARAATRLGQGQSKAAPASGLVDGFANQLGRMIEGVEQTSSDANTAVANMMDKSGEVHDAMIALQRAEMQLQLTVQIRNKLVQAYQEIMRMPI